ncbi:G2 mitotic-specific cyclin S13-7-like isoform X1 [Olea europaea subsp. europaea]|uniref:G2 mitotic-specific cyclin S13-7-like isoform X1 n=1 Tax=Olea europaea subsp. europaea TaxID=158383 RepID=A0A8S0UAC5_OLEEU|nr:G2 mitotic-specific cyclin S13-7-like isoform X1 [Olea europaea subsp. europaea]
MDSRQNVQQQNREAAAVPGGVKKQNNMAAERKNRRALGDIGNHVTIPEIDGKPLPQICRPVTRSFCAQLLANAQAAAAEKTKKNSMSVNANGGIAVDGAIPKDVAKKPAQKKAITKPKPKPEEIINISSDAEEAKKEKPVVSKEKAEQQSLEKKAPTLTSTLTARSKAACGQIVDIDAADVNNDLAVVEYVEEIYKFYKLVENESRVHDYMDSQPEINEKMRAILVDWLIQVHHKFELSPETLYLTINIVDRYLAVKTTSRRELQLLGISSMLIASKYEEIWAPEVNDLVCISDRAYTNEQVLRMEKRILGELEWNLTVPTPYVFLLRFIKASLPDSDASISRLGYEPYKVENLVYFLAELGMMNYATVIHCPSMIAASAVYAARCTLNKVPVWTKTLKIHTGFSEPQLMECAKLLVSFHSMAAAHKLKVIYKKYSSPERGAVALLPPAQSLLAAS